MAVECGSAFTFGGSGSRCFSQCGSGSSFKSFVTKLPYEEFTVVDKNKRLFKCKKNHEAGSNLLNLKKIQLL